MINPSRDITIPECHCWSGSRGTNSVSPRRELCAHFRVRPTLSTHTHTLLLYRPPYYLSAAQANFPSPWNSAELVWASLVQRRCSASVNRPGGLCFWQKRSTASWPPARRRAALSRLWNLITVSATLFRIDHLLPSGQYGEGGGNKWSSQAGAVFWEASPHKCEFTPPAVRNYTSSPLSNASEQNPLVQHSDADTVIEPAQSIKYFGRLVVECPLPEMGLIAWLVKLKTAKMGPQGCALGFDQPNAGFLKWWVATQKLGRGAFLIELQLRGQKKGISKYIFWNPKNLWRKLHLFCRAHISFQYFQYFVY